MTASEDRIFNAIISIIYINWHDILDSLVKQQKTSLDKPIKSLWAAIIMKGKLLEQYKQIISARVLLDLMFKVAHEVYIILCAFVIA